MNEWKPQLQPRELTDMRKLQQLMEKIADTQLKVCSSGSVISYSSSSLWGDTTTPFKPKKWVGITKVY